MLYARAGGLVSNCASLPDIAALALPLPNQPLLAERLLRPASALTGTPRPSRAQRDLSMQFTPFKIALLHTFQRAAKEQ